MFNNLGDRFKDIFKKVSGQGKLTENNMKDALREVRLALLEADVNTVWLKTLWQRFGKRHWENRLLVGLILHNNL